MTCKIALLKAILALLNTVLPILGTSLIALSVYELKTSTPGSMQHISIVVQIFIGSFVVLTSFLGCFGLCRESLSLTWSYAICMLMLLAFQIYILAVSGATDYVQNASDHYDVLWENTSLNSADIALLQQEYECCGKKSPRDYISMSKSIPESCYKDYNRVAENLYSVSCSTAVQEQARKSSFIGWIIKFSLFGFELLGLSFATLMGITIRNKRRREQFENN